MLYGLECVISLGMRFELFQFSANPPYIFRDSKHEEGTMLLFNLFLRYYTSQLISFNAMQAN